jgi:hypothetical protein
MAHSCTRAGEKVDLCLIQVNAVHVPDIISHPAKLFGILDWTAAKPFETEALFVKRLREVCV